MDLYRVSDGAYERNKIPLSRFDSWPDVLASISEALEIPVENAVCFGGDGRQLDEAVFHELWEKGGGEGDGGGVYVFDREAWSVQPEEWVRGLEEDVVLDIELPGESCATVWSKRGSGPTAERDAKHEPKDGKTS